ncbi:DinB family protein [Mucilaginibacter myungsuensis]|uniref:DinB family protein n=1 Tax=Mucilaginibacter myungsuensis TaxID=649104 RepID=A0A929KZP4_9SPHI|nr:DinB family protein [Mucilaginibacter myungsuensis]MBE9664674.1 DinB family protein [Mucilaginibacter myungsuensis]MDN3601121.1 DinB family protein [Mucilaginibacter myungsuensis]
MKKLSLLIGMLAMACTTAFGQITKEQNIAEWTRAKNYTKAYLDAMPEDGYTFKATPDVRSFAEQMLHLAGANYMFSASAIGQKPPAEANAEKAVKPTKEAVTKAVLDSYDYAIKTIQSIPADQLGQEIKLFGMQTTKGLALAKAFEHQTHHRGQTTPYLRLKGIKPPAEMLF